MSFQKKMEILRKSLIYRQGTKSYARKHPFVESSNRRIKIKMRLRKSGCLLFHLSQRVEETIEKIKDFQVTKWRMVVLVEILAQIHKVL